MKIAACDFDGTLFRDGVVSEADLEAIADWRRSGNAFGIVTGRGRNTLLRDVKRFSIPYDFLICNNGAMICDEQAQDVYCAVLPEPVRAEIMDHPGMRASSQCAFFAGTAIFTHAGKTDYWILKEHVLPRLSPVEALHMPGLHQISLAYAEPGESAAWSEAFTEGCGENAGVHFSNICIDITAQKEAQDEILRIWKETGMTAIMVTHDVDEAVYLSDKVVVMTPRPGRITGTLDIKLARPRARSSEDFLHYRAEILRQLHYGGTIKEPNYYI